ncbi:MAG: hypothetical protein M9932_15015 [Xanthobacteraceae bacterium]|nr:hypothetical protein [Xanthobacteraceae bacterium]
MKAAGSKTHPLPKQLPVVTGLDPVTHQFREPLAKMDGRIKSGHDEILVVAEGVTPRPLPAA